MSVDWKHLIDVQKVMQWVLTDGARIVFLVVGGYVAIRILSLSLRRIRKFFEDDDPTTQSEREKRAETLTRVINNVLLIVVWAIVGMMILRQLGVDIGPILAGAGIIGVAVGFGAQSLVKDFLAGIFIMIENQFRVGDVIQAAGQGGIVEKITLRTTTIRDLSGNVHVIPNGQIAVVTNMTKEWSRYMFDVGVAYKEDVDHVMEVLSEIGEELRKDEKFGPMIREPLQILGVDSFGDSAVNIRVMFTTEPLQQWNVGREFRRRIKKTFDERGIEIPFPHRTIYLGEGPPMDARLKVEVAPAGGARQEPPAGGSEPPRREPQS
jgi:small-conductance mechanosensitive channel